MTKAIFPGSFDPVTYGHMDLFERAAGIVDELIIAVLVNKAKNPLFSVDERVTMLTEVTRDLPNVTVKTFEGLLVDFAQAEGANVIVRGLRMAADFEYENQIAQTNHTLNSDIETIFFTSNLEFSYLSSTAVREAAAFGADISKMVPPEVEKMVCKKYQNEV